MKCFLFVLITIFSLNICHADTVSIDWISNGTTYAQTTCNMGGDLEIPTTNPTKPGYTFRGWKIKGYTPIEYLQSTGTQWIDTGVIPTNNMDFDTSFAVTDTSTSGTSFLGSRTIVSGGTGLNIGHTSNKIMVVDFFGSSLNARWTTNTTITQNTKYRIKIENKVATLYADGSVAGTHAFTYNGTTSLSLFFGALNNAGAAAICASPTKFYSLKIYNNGTLIRDFIPVLDPDVPCLFDKVSGQFFYNAGTGDFIAGPVVGK